MSKQPYVSRTQRFEVGDLVNIVGPVARTFDGMTGTVTELLPVDVVYRYRVRFENGTTVVFFGFELEKILERSA